MYLPRIFLDLLIYIYAALPFFIILGLIYGIVKMRQFDNLVRSIMEDREEVVDVEFGNKIMRMTREQEEQWKTLPRSVKRQFINKKFKA